MHNAYAIQKSRYERFVVFSLRNTINGSHPCLPIHFLTEFPSADLLFRGLESNIIDGIFMDKFKAGHYLHSRNKSNLKVFPSVDTSEGVKYDLAVLNGSANNACFKSAIIKRDVDELLLHYLKPIAVRNISDLIRTEEGYTNTVIIIANLAHI